MANLDEAYDIDHRTAAFENHEHGLLVCLAGPGTGKTHSLLSRIAVLTARGCDPSALCYVTFIKEISNAFVADYIERFGDEAYRANAPRISTLHSFACRLLRNQGFRIDYDGELSFANVAHKEDGSGAIFLSDLLPIVDQDGCRTIAQLCGHLKLIKKAWRDCAEPLELRDPAPRIFQAALDLLRCFRLLDWDQTIPLAHTLLNGPDATPQWMARIRHYLVDEYQDFNRAEQALIRLITASAESAVIVGDDDQSVYSDRGGSLEGMRLLYESREHDHVSLIRCRRGKQNLLTPANTFQASMSDHPRPMVAAFEGGQVLCYRFKSSKAETAFLTEYLKTRVAELPEAPTSKDGIVCLFPTHRVLDCYYELLSAKVLCVRRNVSVPSNRLWLERILQLVKRPRQRFLERLLLTDYAALKPRHCRMIIERILERDCAPSEACASLLSDNSFTYEAAAAAHAFCETCDAIASRDPARISSVIAGVLNVKEMLIFNELEKLIHADDDLAQEDFVATICDNVLPETAVPPRNPRAILFLTMHGAKGLTKKTVVIPGLEQAWLPGDATGIALSERKRLFYVAITRATDNLLLTFPHNRGKNESLNFRMPGRGTVSSFIASTGVAVSYHV